MPELPEVETVRRGLERLIVGKRVASVAHDTEKGFPNAPHDVEQFLVGAHIKPLVVVPKYYLSISILTTASSSISR